MADDGHAGRSVGTGIFNDDASCPIDGEGSAPFPSAPPAFIHCDPS
ncbi:hypothetical protein [Sorangium sp. So ce1097]